MGKDYYNILGVDKAAPPDEIKKAFRKKAHQFHPDKSGGDEAKFKEINEAYQVLGDSKKRSQYDQYGSAFENGQAGGGFRGFEGFRDFSGFASGFSGGQGQGQQWNVDMEDLGEIFGGIGDMFGFGSRRGGAQTRQGRDLQMLLTIEFREAVFGVEKELSLSKKIKCDKCSGNGAEPGTKIETCKTCNGSGREIKVQRTILGSMQVQVTCSDCAGEGKKFAKACSKCSGSGAHLEKVNIKIKIPAGIDDGETIRLSGQGEAGEKGAAAGDLYLKLRVTPDKRFIRDGCDIRNESEIGFTQAALGDTIEIETIDGKVNLKIPAGTQSEAVFKLRARGVTRLQGGGRGDHFVKIIVKTPSKLSRKQKELLKDLNL